MHNVIAGLSGWARTRQSQNDKILVVDTAITVVGAVLVALSWEILRH